MKRLQTPTLLGLILVGFLVVALPLIATIVTAIVQVDSLARDSRAALAKVQINTGATRELVDRVTAMERTARQYQALRDETYRDLYRTHREEMLGILDQLSESNDDLLLNSLLADIRFRESRSHAVVEAIGDTATPAEVVAAFDVLRESTMAMASAQNELARKMGNEMPEEARRLQRLLLGQAALVIPLSAGLAALFAVLLSRPLRQLHHGIRSLGRGALGGPLRVTGARDFEELGHRLEWLRTRLIELEAQKRQFLMNVSHELKTPLTNIREGAELLVESDDGNAGSSEIRAIARIVRENSVRLQRMIEELLRFGADGDITSGEMEDDVPLDRIVADTVEAYTLAAAAREVTLNMSLDSVVVRGNAKRLHAIADNLLSNAAKHTPRGGRIDVELRSRDGVVTLDVQDSGPGISKDDEPHLFEWFFTGRQPADSVVAGTGMGLAIAQEYAQQHGGNLRLVESSGGAHFRLTIGGQEDDNA